MHLFNRMLVVASLALMGCGDNVDAPFAPGSTGSGGAAGSSPIIPPQGGSSTGGAAGSVGGSAGSEADGGTCNPGATCTVGVAPNCTRDGLEYKCVCGVMIPAALEPNFQCSDAGTGGSSGAAGSSAGGSSTGGAGGSSTGGAGGTANGGSGGSSQTAQCDSGIFGQSCTVEGEHSHKTSMTCKCNKCVPDYLVPGMNCGAGGSGGTGGTSGAGGSGGSAGSATGGSAGSFAGGSSTGGAGGSSAGGSSTGGSSTGGAGGSTSALGTLEITAVPPTSGTHDITLITNCTNCLAGENSSSNSHATATRITVSLASYEGSVRKVNGYYDPPSGQSVWTNQLCDPQKLTLTATVWAKFNGQYVGKPQVVSNGQLGCDLLITAKAATGSSNDVDGDGDVVGSDCNDSDPRMFHGQIETPDDDFDFNCDSDINPPRVAVRLYASSGYSSVTLTDYSHSGAQTQLAWNAGGYYEAQFLKSKAPTDFIIQYGSNWDVGYWDGSCHRSAAVTVSDVSANTQYTVNMSQVGNPAYTCHDSVTY